MSKYYPDVQTERELSQLEKNIKEMYTEASEEMRKYSEAYFDTLKERVQKEYTAYLNGDYTKEEFIAWYQTQVQRGEGYKIMTEKLANRATQADLVAQAYINDATPSIFSLNANYEAYRINNAYDNVDFQLYNEQTVRRLMGQANHIEFKTVSVNPIRDYAWNRKEIHKALTAGILQGKSIDELTTSYLKVMGRDEASARRNARTSVTSAQNAGRIETYYRASAMGIELKKEWICTHDARTRDSHADLDGERVDYTDTFSNGLMYPADPDGRPAEVYNCRCTIRAIIPDVNDGKRRTYKDWYAEQEQKQAKEEKQKAINGKKQLGIEEKKAKPTENVIKYKFVEAKTIAEAEDYVKATLGVERALYKGIDIELANAINLSLTEAFNYSEEIRNKLRTVGNAQEVNKAFKKALKEAFIKDGVSPDMAERSVSRIVGRVGGNVLAYARDTLADTDLKLYPSAREAYNSFAGICINSKFCKYEAMKKATKRCVATKFHPVGCEEPRSVIDHELGHILDFTYGLSKSPELKKAYSEAKKMGIDGAVSRYAGESLKEFIAEGYSEYLNNPEAREMATLIGKELEKRKAFIELM